MDAIKSKIDREYGHRLRVRVCGICIEDNRILMVCHRMSNSRVFWSPPGGGMDFGRSAEENLKREFLEETGLEMEVLDFLFVNEFLQPPLHAVELFYKVRRKSGLLKIGEDPEMSGQDQIIEDVKFMELTEISNLSDGMVHQMLNSCKDLQEILDRRGYFLFDK